MAMVKVAVAVPILIGAFLLTENLTTTLVCGILIIVGIKDYDLDRKERNNNAN